MVYDRNVRQGETNPSVPEDLDMKLKCAAHHEAGHIVIAAAQELRLRPEGLMVDLFGDGLACYCKQPDESDVSRERVIVATWAGFRAEKRFREERSYPARSELDVIGSPDRCEALKLLKELPGDYFTNERKLDSRLEYLIERHWLPITALATALLAKDPEPLKPLKSGATWSQETSTGTTARYVVGEEVVSILRRYGIAAVCDPNC
jgi:hypothetical protein